MTSDPRHLAAVWFSDLVGFTSLSASDETLAIRVVRIVHDCAKSAAEEGGGRVVKLLGDGVLAEFSSAEAAVRSALSLNLRANRETGRLRGGPFFLRTGVHVGEIAVSDDGDIYGSGVNVASRLTGEAEPGTVLVSDDLYRLLRQRREFTFEALGTRSMKGLEEELSVYQVAASQRLTTMILQDDPGGVDLDEDDADEAALTGEDDADDIGLEDEAVPEFDAGIRESRRSGTRILGSTPVFHASELDVTELETDPGVPPPPGSLVAVLEPLDDPVEAIEELPSLPPEALVAPPAGPPEDEIKLEDSTPDGPGRRRVSPTAPTLILGAEGSEAGKDGASAYTRVIRGGGSKGPAPAAPKTTDGPDLERLTVRGSRPGAQVIFAAALTVAAIIVILLAMLS